MDLLYTGGGHDKGERGTSCTGLFVLVVVVKLEEATREENKSKSDM